MPSASSAGETVAERLGLAREHVVHALDEGHRGAQPPDRLGHLDADRAAAEHEHPARHLRQRRHLAVRPDALELDKARDRREDWVRAGRHDECSLGV